MQKDTPIAVLILVACGFVLYVLVACGFVLYGPCADWFNSPKLESSAPIPKETDAAVPPRTVTLPEVVGAQFIGDTPVKLITKDGENDIGSITVEGVPVLTSTTGLLDVNILSVDQTLTFYKGSWVLQIDVGDEEAEKRFVERMAAIGIQRIDPRFGFGFAFVVTDFQFGWADGYLRIHGSDGRRIYTNCPAVISEMVK